MSLQNGVWVLPATEALERLLRDELAQVERQGGTGLLFQAQALGSDLIARFHDERDQEYAEVCERCQALRDELTRESRAGKETYAELEENEQELVMSLPGGKDPDAILQTHCASGAQVTPELHPCAGGMSRELGNKK